MHRGLAFQFIFLIQDLGVSASERRDGNCLFIPAETISLCVIRYMQVLFLCTNIHTDKDIS